MLAKQKTPRVTKKDIVHEIQCRWPHVRCTLGKTALGRGVIGITNCWHGECERIGQFVFRTFSKQIYTYTVCHIFKKGTVAIFFKR